jgi:hypothetical protein
MSCTGEYGALFIDGATTDADKSQIMAQMVVTMTRVNGVYEREESRFNLCLTILTLCIMIRRLIRLMVNITIKRWRL